MGIEMGVKEKLACLAKVARKAPTDREILADQIRDAGGIVDVSIMGFKVHIDGGLLEVDFPGGLTEELYFDFAPLLEPWDQADLAKGVLLNLTRHSYLEFDEALRLLSAQHDYRLEDWLPERVADVGFAAIAEEIDAALIAFRKEHPKPRIAIWCFERPRFDRDSGHLYWGGHRWHFRNQGAGIVRQLLCALEDEGFPPSITPDLDPAKVHDAQKILQKTKPILIWHVSLKGCLSWEIRK